MEKICFAQGEVNASIMKDFLVSQGIHASYAPDDGPFLSSGASKGPTQLHAIYVEREKVQEAMRLLKEEGLLDHPARN